MEEFYKRINLPEKCYLNKMISKDRFTSSEKIDEDYSYIFNSYVENITLKYSLKFDILNIDKMKDTHQDYGEIEVLEVDLNNHLAVYDVAMVIGRNIPYPLIIVFTNGDRFKLASYRVRENKGNYYKNVVEDVVVTGWFKQNEFYGRINKIISEIDFYNLCTTNMFTMFNSYYKTFEKYKAKYIAINEVVDAFSIIKGITHSKEKLLKKCKSTTVDDSAHTKIEIYKTNKMDKYNNTISNAKILLCKDDLYQYIKDNSSVNFGTFTTFEEKIVELKRKKDIEDSLKRKHSKWDCYYYDGKQCINSYSSYYGKNCTRAAECGSFRRELRKKEKHQIDLDKSLFGLINNREKEVFNNTNNDIAEYGDTVEVLNIDKDIIKRFMIINNSLGTLPEIPKNCLNKNKEYTFEVKNTKYQIKNIIKNTTINEPKEINEDVIIDAAKEQTKIQQEVVHVDVVPKVEENISNENIVEYGDVIEVVNMKNNKIEYFEIKKVDKFTPIINVLCLGKTIDYKFKNGGDRYRIIGIKKGAIV